MTPKLKAKELSMKFDKHGETDNAKQCALIAVDEILDLKLLFYQAQIDKSNGIKPNNSQVEYWQEVKTEIEKL